VKSAATAGTMPTAPGVGMVAAARAAAVESTATTGTMSTAPGVEKATAMRTAAVRPAAVRAAAMRATVRSFMLSERGVWDADERERYN